MRAWFAEIGAVLALSLLTLLGRAAHGQSQWLEARSVADYLDQADFEAAESLTQSLRALWGDDPAVLWSEANILFHRGRYAEASERIALARALDPNARVVELARLIDGTIAVVGDYRTYTTSGGHFEIRYHPRDEVLLPWADRALEGAYYEIGYDIGFWPQEPVRIEFLSRAQQLAEVSSLTLEAVEESGTIALCKYNKLIVTSPRGTARGYGWLDTMAHEYVHYAVAHLTHRDLPIWLHEAIAKYLEQRWTGRREMHLEPSREDMLGDRIAARDLVTFDEMHPSMAYLPAEDAGVAYAQVFTIMEFIVARRGSAAIRDLLWTLRGGAELEAAFEQTFGEPFDVFETSWMAWLMRRPRVELPGAFDDEHIELLPDGAAPAEVDRLDGVESVEARDYLQLGELLRARGHVEASVVEYRRAEALIGPQNPVVQNALGRALTDLDRPTDALEALAELDRWYPDYYLTHLNRAMALNRLGRHDEALVALDLAAGINPFDPAVHDALADAYEALGRTDDAVAARRREQLVSP